ncbi:LysR family transcriptional regulator [Boseaceae bacterium BT-24-1]|nr:LysR family transcriptional regulator [Boseaceae bacterium BT-24-1]
MYHLQAMHGFQAKALTNLTESDLRLLRIFRVVAEAGGLTAAEPRLHMELSTISRHIKALEDRLAGTLCIRGPAGFELTDLGRVALKVAVMAGDTLDRARDELNLARSVITGELRIGIADNCLSNGKSVISQAIADFSQQAPAVDLYVSVRPPNELVDELLARHFHLCVLAGAVPEDKIVLDHLFDEEFRLYAGRMPSQAVHVSELETLGYALIARENSHKTTGLGSRLGIPQKAVASGLEAVATLLASGRFVGFLPTHYVSAIEERHCIREVAGAEALSYHVDFFLGRETNRPMSSQADLMTRLLVGSHSRDLS